MMDKLFDVLLVTWEDPNGGEISITLGSKTVSDGRIPFFIFYFYMADWGSIFFYSDILFLIL